MNVVPIARDFTFPLKVQIKHRTFTASRLRIIGHYVNVSDGVPKREYKTLDIDTLMDSMYCADYIEGCYEVEGK